MRADAQQWNLFGYDVSRFAHYVRAGWRELLWGERAGVRRHLDAPVELFDETRGTSQHYIAECPVDDSAVPAGDSYRALCLPGDRVLIKSLTLPAVLELELDNAIALEVQSSSPFGPDNSCHGWVLRERSGDSLHLVLAIAARSEVDAWLAARGQGADGEQPLPEVWVLDDHRRPIVLEGFGENRRYRAYSRRVGAFAARLGFIALCLITLAAVPGVVRSLQSERMEGYLQQAEREASEAQALREQLAQGNARAQALQELIDQQVDYHRMLERLSDQAPDGVYLQRLEAEGRQARLMGWADNAAAFMQVLTGDDTYSEVRTPSAFSRDRRTGLERFVLELQLSAGGGQ